MKGTVITGDAGFTCRDLAGHILAIGWEYLLRIKGNAGTVHDRLKALPWSAVPEAAKVISVGHGRAETRTIRVIDLAASRDAAYARRGGFYPGAVQAAKIVRRRKVNGRWQVRTVYVITSLGAGQVDPALLATWVQDHWGIEVRLHWIKDVTWGQDACRVRRRNGPANLAAFNTLALNAHRLAGWTNMEAAQDEHQLVPTLALHTFGLLSDPLPASSSA
ncbi:Transposase DDE domain-containing protein [Quadrisphaera granulorum]|uniref:DDE family transposase n=1 Tax=Quadrisphaera granulorum TaxID=317664 RepID=A0A316A7L4_9ACTN|nr:ISAs1 family transposase [Quadrisphaera granulorum]PWJ53926.1 DDE family transposase [Quadrisphaera granulorum]SZE96383.1 Transposase DDE domain-containing protein [Quadrisphaera granulorum]